MPEKNLTVATYAAGASLAAITLIYVFAPTYFIDDNSSASSGFLGSRKKGVVGLSNPANDCFINSVLQALAGLGDLRLYLIRELHRRTVDEAWVYGEAVPAGALDDDKDGSHGAGPRKDMPEWKIEGLQSGIVTRGLKDILDALNERPIYKKTITAAPFVRTLELAFRQRISRQQQDAQEFLQVVAERLCDEYHAGRRARAFARRKFALSESHGTAGALNGHAVGEKLAELATGNASQVEHADGDGQKPQPAHVEGSGFEDEEEGFPMEGRFESQIECLTCEFKPKPTESTFCTLTLNVPQMSSTTLNACFDGMFKTEYIDDFKCEKCRLVHAIGMLEAEARTATSESHRQKIEEAIAKLQHAVATDPEHPPPDVELPDVRYAPKRKIARHIRLTHFPKILAIHLSRSIFDPRSFSQKNLAKVTFQERLPLGGLANQRKYKLLGLVTHKGSHHSGHYESFRRQNQHLPFSNPATFQPSGVYSKAASPATTPRVGAGPEGSAANSPALSTPELAPADTGNSSTPSLDSLPANSSSRRSLKSPKNTQSSPSKRSAPTSAPRERDTETNSLLSVAASARSTLSRITSRPSSHSSKTTARDGSPRVAGGDASKPDTAQPSKLPSAPKPKRRKPHERWWRISDDKVKEASTRDVLGMQKEVYLLFYELERDEP